MANPAHLEKRRKMPLGRDYSGLVYSRGVAEGLAELASNPSVDVILISGVLPRGRLHHATVASRLSRGGKRETRE